MLGLGLLQCDGVSLYCIPAFQKKTVSSYTRFGAMGPSQTRENPTAQRHFPMQPSHLYISGKHKSRNRKAVPWRILTMSEYYMCERHSVFSCIEPCSDIVYKIIYAVDQGRIKLFGAPRQWKHFRPLFQAVFLSGGGGITPQTIKHHASQSQDRNNKYFILYIEFCINNKI